MAQARGSLRLMEYELGRATGLRAEIRIMDEGATYAVATLLSQTGAVRGSVHLASRGHLWAIYHYETQDPDVAEAIVRVGRSATL